MLTAQPGPRTRPCAPPVLVGYLGWLSVPASPGDRALGGLESAVLAAGNLVALHAGRRDIAITQLHVGWAVLPCVAHFQRPAPLKLYLWNLSLLG